MATGTPLPITVIEGGTEHTYVFPLEKRPSLLALSCLTGPKVFYPEGAAKPYTNPWILLEDLPRGRVVARDWTPKTIAKQNKFFVEQLGAFVQDIDARLAKVRSDGFEAASLRELQNNLRTTIARERK